MTVRTWRSLGICAIGASALLAGCGGGGGGSSSTPKTPASSLLLAQAGQTWTYKYTGTGKATDGTNYTLSGTVVDTNTTTNVTGATLANVATGTLTGAVEGNSITVPISSASDITVDATSHTQTQVASQDAIGSAPHFFASPQIYLPGTFSSTTSINESTTLTDTGATLANTFTVIGSETVTVPAGTFATWKVSHTEVDGDTTSTETDWFAPEIGSAVKTTVLVNYPAPLGQITLTAELTSTNVAH